MCMTFRLRAHVSPMPHHYHRFDDPRRRTTAESPKPPCLTETTLCKSPPEPPEIQPRLPKKPPPTTVLEALGFISNTHLKLWRASIEKNRDLIQTHTLCFITTRLQEDQTAFTEENCRFRRNIDLRFEETINHLRSIQKSTEIFRLRVNWTEEEQKHRSRT